MSDRSSSQRQGLLRPGSQLRRVPAEGAVHPREGVVSDWLAQLLDNSVHQEVEISVVE